MQREQKKVSNIGNIMFYFIILLLSHECCVLLPTRQQLPHFHPLLSHDRVQKVRERRESERESQLFAMIT
jgi:hypothetical protein